MSNLTALKVVAARAEIIESSRNNFNQPLTVKVPTTLIAFVATHIAMLEQQLEDLRLENDLLRSTKLITVEY